MVAACLGVNMWNTFRLAEIQRANCERISNEIGARYFESDQAEQIELIYNRSFEAFQKRQCAFALSVAKFEKLVDKYSVLKVVDPSKVHLIDSEVLEPKGGFHERFRIWIPNSPTVKLQLGFHNTDNTFERNKNLRRSDHFRPANTFDTSLQKGESIVDLIGSQQADAFVLQLLINSKLVHETSRTSKDGKPQGSSKTGLSMQNCIDLDPQTRLIFSIERHFQNNQKECIAIKIVAPNRDREEP